MSPKSKRDIMFEREFARLVKQCHINGGYYLI